MSSAVMGLLAAGVCAFVVFLDVIMFQGLGRQLQSSGFPTVPGRIVHNELKDHGSEDGFSAKIAYTYTVAGREWTGTKLRFCDLRSNSHSSALCYLDQFPFGQEVSVYYDPHSPDQAALLAGFWPDYVMMMIGVAPFQVAAVYLAWPLIDPLFFRRRLSRLRSQLLSGKRTSFAMPDVPPWVPSWLAGLIAAGAAAFIASFIFFLFFPVQVSMTQALTIWAVIIAIGLLAALWRHRQFKTGIADLGIDLSNHTLTLPTGSWRIAGFTVSFSEIDRLTVLQLPAEVTTQTAYGTSTRSYPVPTYELTIISSEGRHFPIARYSSEDLLQQIAETLRPILISSKAPAPRRAATPLT